MIVAGKYPLSGIFARVYVLLIIILSLMFETIVYFIQLFLSLERITFNGLHIFFSLILRAFGLPQAYTRD